MKKALPFLISLLSFSYLQAQIEYINYGPEGWVIPINANVAVDVEGDGLNDFYINSWPNELGFVPEFISGCFASPSENAYTNFGARELQLLQVGDLVQINDSNLFDYIDEDRGSAYQVGGGFAEGWSDLEDQYIGFVVFPADQSVVRHGWLRMSIDETNKTLIIKEMAYTEEQPFNNTGGIIVGDKGATAVSNLDHVLSAVSITPNPADALAQVSFDYNSLLPLNISVVDTKGQTVLANRQPIFNGSKNIQINTSEWATGTYFIHFKNEEGVHTERLLVQR